MSKEIEESIIKSLKLLNEHILKENQTLLSSLEKVQGELKRFKDLPEYNRNLAKALENEKERADKAEVREENEYRLRLVREEQANSFRETLEGANKQVRELEDNLQKLVEAVESIKKLVDDKETAVLLGPGWTVATISQIVKKVLEEVK